MEEGVAQSQKAYYSSHHEKYNSFNSFQEQAELQNHRETRQNLLSEEPQNIQTSSLGNHVCGHELRASSCAPELNLPIQTNSEATSRTDACRIFKLLEPDTGYLAEISETLTRSSDPIQLASKSAGLGEASMNAHNTTFAELQNHMVDSTLAKLPTPTSLQEPDAFCHYDVEACSEGTTTLHTTEEVVPAESTSPTSPKLQIIPLNSSAVSMRDESDSILVSNQDPASFSDQPAAHSATHIEALTTYDSAMAEVLGSPLENKAARMTIANIKLTPLQYSSGKELINGSEHPSDIPATNDTLSKSIQNHGEVGDIDFTSTHSVLQSNILPPNQDGTTKTDADLKVIAQVCKTLLDPDMPHPASQKHICQKKIQEEVLRPANPRKKNVDKPAVRIDLDSEPESIEPAPKSRGRPPLSKSANFVRQPSKQPKSKKRTKESRINMDHDVDIVGLPKRELITTHVIARKARKLKGDSDEDYSDSKGGQKQKKKAKLNEIHVPQHRAPPQRNSCQPSKKIKATELITDSPGHASSSGPKRQISGGIDGEYADPPVKKPRLDAHDRAVQTRCGGTPVPQQIDLTKSEVEEEVVVAKEVLDDTGNAFPRFSSGDIYIALGGNQAYRLHSNLLIILSPWFKDALKPRPNEPRLKEQDENLAKALKTSTKLRSRFELIQSRGEMKLLRCTFTTSLPLTFAVIEKKGKHLIAKESDSNPDRHSNKPEKALEESQSIHFGRCPSPQDTLMEQGPKNMKHEVGKVGERQGIAQDNAYRILEAYENLFRIYYCLPTCISHQNIQTAVVQSETLLAVADKHESIDQVRPHLSASIMDFGLEVYLAVARDPRRWLDISINLRSAPIFKEAVTHIIGNYPKWRATVINHSEYAIEVNSLLQTKLQEFNSFRAKIDEALLESTIKVNGKGLRLLDLSPEHCNTWLVVRYWHDWFASSRVQANKVYQSGSLDATTYRRMLQGGNAYLDIEETIAFIERFRNTQLTYQEVDEVESDLRTMKEFAMKTVKPLVANKSMLSVEDNGILHYTCVNVLDEELPWYKNSRKELDKCHDQNVMRQTSSGARHRTK